MSYAARSRLHQLFTASVYSNYLRVSREKANELIGECEDLQQKLVDSDETNVGFRATIISQMASDFKRIFLSEISLLPVFIVQQKANYDTLLLIDHGVGLFPPGLIRKVPDAAYDAGEVGKALAFNLMTACGFHMFRVLECVLRRYWGAVCPGQPLPAPGTIGVLATKLEAVESQDARVPETLRQIARLHRNPCIHPEVAFSEADGITALGVVSSVIAVMLAYIPDAPLPTTVAAS